MFVSKNAKKKNNSVSLLSIGLVKHRRAPNIKSRMMVVARGCWWLLLTDCDDDFNTSGIHLDDELADLVQCLLSLLSQLSSYPLDPVVYGVRCRISRNAMDAVR
jgi:hypothetical protein